MVLPVRAIPIDWRRRKYFPHQKSPILRHSVQCGLVTILTSQGNDPLKFWSVNAGIGTIQRIVTSQVDGLVLELSSPAFCTTHISAPEDIRMKMGCTMPILGMIIEYLNKPFCFEFQLVDSKNLKRRFRISACQVKSKVSHLICHMPLVLHVGWNKVEVDLHSLTRLSYNSNYIEFLGLQIYANCRIRKVYFADRKYEEEELPKDYLLAKPRPAYDAGRKNIFYREFTSFSEVVV